MLVVGHENGLDGAQPAAVALEREIVVKAAGDDAAAARVELVPSAAAHHARSRLAAPHGRVVKREAQYRPSTVATFSSVMVSGSSVKSKEACVAVEQRIMSRVYLPWRDR